MVVGVSETVVAGTQEAFRWTETTGMIGLGGLAGAPIRSAAIGTSADGSVIVGEVRDTDNISQAFRWTSSTGMVALALPPTFTNASARRVTPDGSVVVGRASSPPQGASTPGRGEAFRWTENDGMVTLGDLPGGGVSSSAYDVSADGSVIVGTGQTFREDGLPTINEAFYWTADNGMLNLRDVLIFGGATGLDGWILTEARGVSADGLTVVGSAIDPNGVTQAFVATIPEPTTLAMALFAALLFATLCFRKRLGATTDKN